MKSSSSDFDSSSGGKRSRSGCLTCRKRHYKCDEERPRCLRCSRDRRDCFWRDERQPKSRRTRETSEATVIGPSRIGYGHERIEDPKDSSQSSDFLPPPLSTKYTDAITFYISRFHEFSYQICAWTGLIPLPKRSTIPSILQIKRRQDRKMTNWAGFFLPHLSTGSSDDPLSLALVAFTALRLKDRVTGFVFYSHVLSLLRIILAKQDASSMNNQVR